MMLWINTLMFSCNLTCECLTWTSLFCTVYTVNYTVDCIMLILHRKLRWVSWMQKPCTVTICSVSDKDPTVVSNISKRSKVM